MKVVCRLVGSCVDTFVRVRVCMLISIYSVVKKKLNMGLNVIIVCHLVLSLIIRIQSAPPFVASLKTLYYTHKGPRL